MSRSDQTLSMALADFSGRAEHSHCNKEAIIFHQISVNVMYLGEMCLLTSVVESSKIVVSSPLKMCATARSKDLQRQSLVSHNVTAHVLCFINYKHGSENCLATLSVSKSVCLNLAHQMECYLFFCIYLTYSSGKKPKYSFWKKEAKFGRWTVGLSHWSYPIRFVTTRQGPRTWDFLMLCGGNSWCMLLACR